MFVHVHGHSHYSLLEAIGSPAKIIDKIKSLGMDSIGIIDEGDMYGAIEFYLQAKKNGIKSLIGIQIDIIQDLSKKEQDRNVQSLTLLSKDLDGYKGIINMASIANTTGFWESPRIDMPLLEQNAKGNILILGGGKDIISKMISAGEDLTKIQEMLEFYINLFGKENIIFEIIAQDYSILPEFKTINDGFIKLAENNQIKLIVGNNFRYINKDDKIAYEVLGRIKEGAIFGGRESIKGDYHILSEEEIIAILTKNGFEKDFIDMLINNNYEISQNVGFEIPLGKIYFPNYQSPNEITELYEKHKNELIGD